MTEDRKLVVGDEAAGDPGRERAHAEQGQQQRLRPVGMDDCRGARAARVGAARDLHPGRIYPPRPPDTSGCPCSERVVLWPARVHRAAG